MLDQVGPAVKEAYVTLAELLRAESEAKGKAEGQALTLVQLLTLRFGPVPQESLDRIQSATTEQLSAWTANFVTADSIDETLR